MNSVFQSVSRVVVAAALSVQWPLKISVKFVLLLSLLLLLILLPLSFAAADDGVWRER